jgi:hypothetical protein
MKKDENYLVKAQETKAGERLRRYKRETRKKAAALIKELNQGGLKRMLCWTNERRRIP